MAEHHVGRLRGAWRLCERSNPTASADPSAPGNRELSPTPRGRVHRTLTRQISEVTQGSTYRHDIVWWRLPDTSNPGPIEEKFAGFHEQIEIVESHAGKAAARRHRQQQEHDRWVD